MGNGFVGMQRNGSSAGTAHHVRRTIRNALNEAVRRGHLARNPVLLMRIRHNRLRPKYEHGCGGTCGRKAGYCPERKQSRADTGPTKSRAGRRVMGLPAPLVLLLQAHKTKQEAERTAARQLWHDEGWVFANPVGRPLNPNTDYHEWKALLSEAGVHDGRLHDARHTAATVHPRRADAHGYGHHGVVERRLATRYQHVLDSILKGVAGQVGGLLWDNPESDPAHDADEDDDGDAGAPVPA